MKIDWSLAKTRFPQKLLKDEPSIKDKLQGLVNNEAAIFRVEEVSNNEYDYRIIVSSPISDDSIENIEKELRTAKIDWVLVEPQPVQRY